MFLLIRNVFGVLYDEEATLHSTMFLLIQRFCATWSKEVTNFTFHNVSINTVIPFSSAHLWTSFTFHNVSINTRSVMPCRSLLLSLHSTMFLLILLAKIALQKFLKFFTFHNVSINTLFDHIHCILCVHFTFHNVSINTVKTTSQIKKFFHLYIPQCFY